MKSRRRMVFPKAQDHAKFGRQFRPSEQEMTTNEIGFKGQFAQQQSCPVYVGSGSKPEALSDSLMSASTSCGHGTARCLGCSVPIPDLSTCSKLSKLYSITSSARPRSGNGTVKPNTLAVFMLIISSTPVAC
jgi:hypothetical protein